MKKAYYIKDAPKAFWSGDAKLYKLSTPLKGYSDDDPVADYIVVSATDAMFTGPETYIFPATAEGKPILMLGYPGSFQGGHDHDLALREAGYTVVYESEKDG